MITINGSFTGSSFLALRNSASDSGRLPRSENIWPYQSLIKGSSGFSSFDPGPEITMDGHDKFTAGSVVDFVEPDGNLIEGVGDGPFTGARMELISTLPPRI